MSSTSIFHCFPYGTFSVFNFVTPLGVTGANCQSQAQECGGTYVANAGNVRYPLNGGSHSSECIWYIEVERDMAMNLTFSTWNFEKIFQRILAR